MPIRYMKNKIINHRGLIDYTILNYIDKLLVFLAPLIILSVFGDKTIYNDIEYVYSLSAIMLVILDFGITNNLLYEYRSTDDEDKLVNRVVSYFRIQILFYLLISISLLIYSVITGKGEELLFYVMVRAIYSYFISFYNLYFRLVDKPSKIFLYSIVTNLLTIITCVIFWINTKKIDTHIFFAVQTIFVVFLGAYFFRKFSKYDFAGLMKYVVKSVKYAWPIILNVFLFMIINNYGKLYARNYLTPDEMTHISLVQRLSLFVQLAHGSAAGYLSKRLFLDKCNKINIKILILYSIMLFGGALVTFMSIPFIWYFKKDLCLNLDSVTLLLIGYTIAWCYGAYFELYLNKYNKNFFLPIFTGVSAVIFICLVHFGPFQPLINISLGMFVSMAINFILILFTVIKIERFQHD